MGSQITTFPLTLRCLEGTTLSNRGHALGLELNEEPLPGGQYAIGQAPGWSEVTVSSLRWRLILYCQGQLFCFDSFLSACGQTRRMGWSDREARLHG